jgi:outer membrane protein assembly factor BamB
MRRAVPALVLALAAIAVAAPGASGQATTLQAGPEHAGFVREPGLSPPLRPAWTRRLPGTMSYPVIADGRVFVAIRRARERGSRLLALSARNGRTLWQRDGPYWPAYDQGRLYVRQDTETEQYLIALSASDGRVLWQRAVGRDTGPPVASGGVVFLSSAWLSAYRGSDGALLWETQTDSTGGTPAIAGDSVYLSFSCEQLAMSRATGAVLWHVQHGCSGGGGTVPVIHAGRMYTREGLSWPPGDIYDSATGAHVGRMRSDLLPAFAGRLGLFADARVPGEEFLLGHTLVARPIGGGRPRWRFRGDGYLDTAPLIVNDTAYVGSGSGRIYGLALRSGRVAWRARLPRPALGSLNPGWGMAAGEGVLVVPAFGLLAAFR